MKLTCSAEEVAGNSSHSSYESSATSFEVVWELYSVDRRTFMGSSTSFDSVPPSKYEDARFSAIKLYADDSKLDSMNYGCIM